MAVHVVVFMPKSKLSFRDLMNWVWFVMKTRQDSNMINCTGAAYTENETKLLQPIRSGVTYAENETRLS